MSADLTERVFRGTEEMNVEGYPRKVMLRGGEEVVLRPMLREDGEDVRSFFASLCDGEKLFLRDDDINPEEAVPWPRELDYEWVLPILALADGGIVGVGTLHRSGNSWTLHVGNIRITVAPDFRRKGLGSVLAGELFRNFLQTGVDKIVAEIVKDQLDVSLFYNGLGFRTEAHLGGHFLDDSGTKHDVLIMSNSLAQLWKFWVERSGREGLGKVVQAR